jgi:hypothetical protein
MTTESASSPMKVDTWAAIACIAFHRRLRNESTPYVEDCAAGIGRTDLHSGGTTLGSAQAVEGATR